MSQEPATLPAPAGVGGDLSLSSGDQSSRGKSWRIVGLAGRREATWLVRSPLVTGSMLVSLWLVWLNNRVAVWQVVWWAADVSIVACMLAVAGGVLLAAHLAAGRAHRDAMQQLYASYPASAAVRTGALLAGAAGPVLLALLATGAAMVWVAGQHALGSPRLWVLGAGPLLVLLGGLLGIALGSWLRHPIAAILAVLVLGLVEIDLVLSVANPIHLPGGTAWLFPWTDPGSALASLPGLTVPYPPPVHLAELAGLIALAVVAAIWRTLSRRRTAAVVAVIALGLSAWSAWSGSRPVPGSVLAQLVREATEPARFEPCQSLHAVRYCYYPAYEPQVRQWAVPVGAVVALIPAADRGRLTVRQVWDADFLTPPLLSSTGLTSILSAPSPLADRLTSFQNALTSNPRLIPGHDGPPVYTDGNWGTGANLGSAQLALAISTAQWATGLPTTGKYVQYSDSSGGGTSLVACVPAGQARAVVALWLAAAATPATRGAFAAASSAGSTQVGKRWIATVAEQGSGPSVGLIATAQEVALSIRMLRMPAIRVDRLLAHRWEYWLRPQTTTARLAAALGVALPPEPLARPQSAGYASGPGGVISDVQYNPPSPVCG